MQASFGIAVALDRADNRSDLLRCADIAMYAAKRQGNGVRLYDTSLEADRQENLRLVEELHRALEHDELTVHVQPKVTPCGEVHAAEALLRWAHPTQGLLLPGAFLQLAEDHKLMPTRPLPELITWLVARGRDVPQGEHCPRVAEPLPRRARTQPSDTEG